MTYATSEEVLAALSLTDDTGAADVSANVRARVDDALAAAKDRVDEYCDRQFDSPHEGSREFEREAHWRLPVRVDDYTNPTAASVAVRHIRDQADFTDVPAADWLAWPRNPRRGRPYTAIQFVRPPRYAAGLIRFTAAFGWQAIPAQVKSATILLAERHFMRQGAPLGIAGTGDFGVAYANRSDSDVFQLLAPYRKTTGV